MHPFNAHYHHRTIRSYLERNICVKCLGHSQFITDVNQVEDELAALLVHFVKELVGLLVHLVMVSPVGDIGCTYTKIAYSPSLQ